MLTIGDKFPSFDLKAVVSTDPRTAFKDISDKSAAGKWKVVFFWPKDFTFVCPTAIAAFGNLTRAFNDRHAPLSAAPTPPPSPHLHTYALKVRPRMQTRAPKSNHVAQGSSQRLSPQQKAGRCTAPALGADHAPTTQAVVDAFGPEPSPEAQAAAKIAASLMAMNNI